MDGDLFLKALTTIIAVAAVYIAYQQYDTARYKVRIDLFDRRYRVYRGLMDLLAAVLSTDGDVPREVRATFYEETDAKRFLFRDDVCDYLTEVRKKLGEWRGHKRTASNTILPEGKQDAGFQAGEALWLWFNKQVDEQVPAKLFGKYIDFKNL